MGNESSYGGSDARSWLLSLGLELLLSLFFWQPLMVYIVTWMHVWMFTWHLELEFPDKIPALCKGCCCGVSEDEVILALSMKPNRYHDNVASEASHASIETNDSFP